MIWACYQDQWPAGELMNFVKKEICKEWED